MNAPFGPFSSGPQRPLRIGLSARVMHRSPLELGFRGKPLQYLETSIAAWIMEHGALALMVPVLETDNAPLGARPVSDYIDQLDGLVLQGGADVAPQTYGQQPLRPEWAGDAVRDRYELALLRECVRQKKPVIGVCRGAQLLNVCFGGTLYQDLMTLRAPARATHPHVDDMLYDELQHDISIEPGSALAGLYPDQPQARVTSIHHQAVDRLGEGLEIEARSTLDGVVEAIRWQGDSLVRGLQWHPEFHGRQEGLLDSAPVMLELLHAAAERAGLAPPLAAATATLGASSAAPVIAAGHAGPGAAAGAHIHKPPTGTA